MALTNIKFTSKKDDGCGRLYWQEYTRRFLANICATGQFVFGKNIPRQRLQKKLRSQINCGGWETAPARWFYARCQPYLNPPVISLPNQELGIENTHIGNKYLHTGIPERKTSNVRIPREGCCFMTQQ
jgi:hypothetical protein